jgi:hypothetical protein
VEVVTGLKGLVDDEVLAGLKGRIWFRRDPNRRGARKGARMTRQTRMKRAAEVRRVTKYLDRARMTGDGRMLVNLGHEWRLVVCQTTLELCHEDHRIHSLEQISQV